MIIVCFISMIISGWLAIDSPPGRPHPAFLLEMQDTSVVLPVIDLETLGPVVREQVQKAYQEAKKDPKDPVIAGRLAMTLHAYGDHESAAAVYRIALGLQPGEFRWIYLLAVSQASAGKNEDAVESFRQALGMRPDYPLVRLRLADLLLSMNRLDESRRLYEGVLSDLPDAPQAHYGLGRIMSKLGDRAGAIRSLTRACELAPSWGAAHYALALVLRDSGATERASEELSLYQRYRMVRPVPVDPMLDEVAGLNNGSTESLKRGFVLESAGKLDESIAEHEKALAINPQLIQAHINLIQLYARTGRSARAEEVYRTAIAFNPNLAEAHYNIGVMYLNQNRYSDAAQAFRRAVEANPQYAEAHLNYGILLERDQKYDDALIHYRAAVENRPDLRQAHFQFARMLIYKGQLPEAIEQLTMTLVPEDDQTPRFTYALAAAYARAGDRANGLKYMRIARDKAKLLNQTDLLTLIERDLKLLEQ